MSRTRKNIDDSVGRGKVRVAFALDATISSKGGIEKQGKLGDVSMAYLCPATACQRRVISFVA